MTAREKARKFRNIMKPFMEDAAKANRRMDWRLSRMSREELGMIRAWLGDSVQCEADFRNRLRRESEWRLFIWARKVARC